LLWEQQRQLKNVDFGISVWEWRINGNTAIAPLTKYAATNDL
jgi:hypothetical protein